MSSEFPHGEAVPALGSEQRIMRGKHASVAATRTVGVASFPFGASGFVGTEARVARSAKRDDVPGAPGSSHVRVRRYENGCL